MPALMIQAAKAREDAAADREREADRVVGREARAHELLTEAEAAQAGARAALEQAAAERRSLEALNKVGCG
jgi:hypothetical protein